MQQEIKETANLKRSASQVGLITALTFAVCVMVLVVHWPAMSAQTVFIDDDLYLTNNLLVQNPSWTSARCFLTEVLRPSTVRGYYQPLAMISLMADCALGGRADNLQPFHRTNLLLHMANTALVIVLLYLLFAQAWIAVALGLLFGLHPMTVEPICWISERKTLLAAFFALWSLIFYVRYARRSNWRFYLGCFVMYILALMSKPTTLPLPVLMLVMDYWPLRRLKWRAVLVKLPLFAVGGVFAIITYISQGRTAGLILPDEHNLVRIPLVICHNIVFYLCKILWPANLSSHYAYPVPMGLSSPAVLAGLIGTCVLVILLVLSLRWTRAVLAGWLFFFIAIFPTMGVVVFTNVIAADKFVYLPSIGLLMILMSFWAWFYSAAGVSRALARSVVVMAVVLMLAGAEAVATRRHLWRWRNSTSLAEYMLTVTPNAAPVHLYMASIFQSQGKLDEALSHYYQALQTEPDHFIVHNNLGVLLKSQGRLDEAVEHYRHALRFFPGYTEAHYNLGVALQLQGKLDESLSHYHYVLQLKPSFAEAQLNLGSVLVSQGKFNEAIERFRQALQLKPGLAKAHVDMAVVFKMQGDIDKAIEHYHRALQIRPNLLRPLNALAWILATHPDPQLRDANKAVELAERAAKLTRYRNVTTLDTLAAAHASAGHFDQAVETAQKAVELASAAQADELANNIRKRLKLYKRQKPYLEPIQSQ